MTNVAYMLFTFIACLLGLGAGLLLHKLWSVSSIAKAMEQDPFASIDKGETASWDAFSSWQADNNRRFATQVLGCGVAPLLFSGLAWSERSGVVQSVCGAVTKAVGQAYICM
jgi:hypothetical protein